jgi:putative transposase
MTAEISKLNQQANLTRWQQLIYECRHSGMTVKAWCEAQGISIKTYYYRQHQVWQATQNPQTSSALPSATMVETIIPCAPPIGATMKPVNFTPSLILRKDNWIVEVAGGFDPTLLRLVLRAVK